MASVILPIVTALLFTGATVDITSFENAKSDETSSIFNDSDIIQTPLGVLNATYYVLPDGKLPYEAIGLPIDMAIRLKSLPINTMSTGALMPLDYRRYDSADVLFVAEYKKFERSVKTDAVPLPDWQNETQKGHTHYVDKTYYGGKVIGLAQLFSNVTGDVHIMRKELTEILGASGKITKNTYDLWTNALKTIDAAPELRGKVQFRNFGTLSRGVRLPGASNSFDDFFKYLPDISNYIVPQEITAPEREERFMPLSVSLKSLHDLDKQYPAVEKNLETEKYLKKADDLWEDLSHAYKKTRSLISLLFHTKDGQEKYNAFLKKIDEVKKVFQDLGFLEANIYQTINTTAYDSAFESYYRGLDKGTDNYYIALMKIFEDNNLQCSNNFLGPINGILSVQANEIYKKGIIEGGIEECRQECLKDSRCRSVGFGEISKMPLFGGYRQICWIYYRSTVTAKIGVPIAPFRDMTIHDRNCKYIRP